MNIQITKGYKSLDLNVFNFPGGEVGVKINTNDLNYKSIKSDYQTIIARIQNSNDIMALIMIKDALERFDKTPIRLFLPYMPYGRQDRPCVNGESFSLKVFANLINSLKFLEVITLDPHSNVMEGVFDNLRVISQLDIINNYFEEFRLKILREYSKTKCYFVSPDAGANKKTAEIAKYFNHDSFIRADKLRNLNGGDIKETIVYADDLSGCTTVICDDLCDGSASFTNLAKVLKAKNASKVILYITHAIFSKGVDIIFNSGIDKIYCTNSYKKELDERVNVLKIDNIIENV